MGRSEVAIEGAGHRMVPFKLALDPQTKLPLYSSHHLPPVSITVYSQGEEARYANLLPGVGSVFAQADLSGGMGKKMQDNAAKIKFDRYYYGECFDASVAGQAQKGIAANGLAAPANSGPLSGFYVLNGVPHLQLGRIDASWASDALTQRNDLGAGNTGAGSAVFFRNGTVTTVDSASPAGTTVVRIDTPDTVLAQQIRMNASGVLPLAKVDVKIQRTGTIAGDVRLRIMADVNGQPSGNALVTARMLASGVPTGSLTVETFRFDNDALGDQYIMNTQESFWVVMDVTGAAAATYIDWLRDTGTSTYSRGADYVSTDGGNTWGVVAGSGEDFYFNVYAQTPTTTAFIGVDTASIASLYTADGVTFTSNGTVYATAFCVVGDLLVRSLRSTNGIGAIEYSDDGVNWSAPVGIGDVTIPITSLQQLGEVLVVCKQDGIYAIDLTSAPTTVDIQALYESAAAATNGQGSCFWRGAVYVPFNGRLVAVEGDFLNGFTVHESVGIECLPEWDWPWGQGRHVACVGTRFHLYSVVSTSGGYRLLKCANPLKMNADDTHLPDPDWHGSLATIGDGSQSITMLAHFDPGGSGSPQLFVTNTGNNIIRYQLPRSFNPAADSSYTYNNTTTGQLYFSRSNGNYPVHPKTWVTEHVTFQQNRANDYVEMLYDDLNGESWRRLPQGRLYDTGALPYPAVPNSTMLARQLQLTNSLATVSPLLHAFAVSYAVRSIPGSSMREFAFTVEVDEGLSAADLGYMLGTPDTQFSLAHDTTISGFRKFTDPYGTTYDRVLFLDATDVLSDTGESGRSKVQFSAVAIG